MYTGLYVDIEFNGAENLLNDIMQDQKRFLAKKVLKISRQKHFPLFTDWVTQSVEERIKLWK